MSDAFNSSFEEILSEEQMNANVRVQRVNTLNFFACIFFTFECEYLNKIHKFNERHRSLIARIWSYLLHRV